MIDSKTIESIGTPFYVFDIDVLKNRINYLYIRNFKFISISNIAFINI